MRKKSAVLVAVGLMTLPLWLSACGGSGGGSNEPFIQEEEAAGSITVRLEMTDAGVPIRPPDPRLANWQAVIVSDGGRVWEQATNDTGTVKFNLGHGRYNVSVRPEEGWAVVQHGSPVVLDTARQNQTITVRVNRGNAQPPSPPPPPDEGNGSEDSGSNSNDNDGTGEGESGGSGNGDGEGTGEDNSGSGSGGAIEPPKPIVSVANSKVEVFGDPPADGPVGTADGVDKIFVYVELYGINGQALHHTDIKTGSWSCTSNRPEDDINGGPVIALGNNGGDAIALWEVKTNLVGTGRYTVRVTDKNGFAFTFGAVTATWIAPPPPPKPEPRLNAKQAAALDDWEWKYDRISVEADQNFYFWIGVENLDSENEVETVITSTGVADVLSAGANAKALVAIHNADGVKLREEEKTLAQIVAGVNATIPAGGKAEIGLAGKAADSGRPKDNPKVVAIRTKAMTEGKEFAAGNLEVRMTTVPPPPEPEPLVDADKSTFKVLGRPSNNFDPNAAKANGSDFIWVYVEACGPDGKLLPSSAIAEWICESNRRSKDAFEGGLSDHISTPDNPNPAIGEWKVRTEVAGTATYTAKVIDANGIETVLGSGTVTWQAP